MKRQSQRGVALVITLIMLSVVTVMTVLFLAVSRRERTSVSVTGDQTDARLMVDYGLGRAQAEVVARMLARSNALEYNLMVSTNFINPAGFQQTSPDTFDRVAYDLGEPRHVPLNGDELKAMLAHLWFDPRPPVFIQNGGSNEFRFYLDLNRNGRFETNGYQAIYDANGNPIRINGVIQTNFLVGDPEWIGVLERPGQPHSRSNQFIGRYAFIVLPAGKSLDLNYMHNQVKQLSVLGDGYRRNQGFGSWELNLAAFLRDLNSNYWGPGSYNYNPALTTASSGAAFDDATALLTYRYNSSFGTLRSVSALYGFRGTTAFRTDLIDGYGEGPIAPANGLGQFLDPDNPAQPWPGSDNTNGYVDLQTLLTIPNATPQLTAFSANRLSRPMLNAGTYDRYSYYRMLAQLGADSAPANQTTLSNYYIMKVGQQWVTNIEATNVAKLNLNYDNGPGSTTTNFFAWTPLRFFTNAADRILRSQFLPGVIVTNNPFTLAGITLTNIPIFPTNLYSAQVHRSLQLAANIYDATTTNAFPSVFRPILTQVGTNIYIAGYTNVVFDANLTNPNLTWLDLNDPKDRRLIGVNDAAHYVYGVPWVVGARKGLPNFNEFSMRTSVQLTRKLEVVKHFAGGRPTQTNQLYQLTITNVVGLEGWNSYTNSYLAPLKLRVQARVAMVLTNGINPANLLPLTVFPTYATNMNVTSWVSNSFLVPILTNQLVLPQASWQSQRIPTFITNVAQFDRGAGFPIPQWGLVVTNRLVYVMTDSNNRPLDVVMLNNLTNYWDLTQTVIGMQNVSGENSDAGQLWLTNRLNRSLSVFAPTIGINNQIQVSLGTLFQNDPALWTSYSSEQSAGLDKSKAIDYFRSFMGLSPLTFKQGDIPASIGFKTSYQAPFSPTRLVYLYSRWSANDPLVHYTVEDLTDLTRTNVTHYANPPETPLPTPDINFNISQINERYSPWDGNPSKKQNQSVTNNIQTQDPLIYRSDDWQFPSNKYANVGWLGRVHRGTPWQTVYFKSYFAPPSAIPNADLIAWTKWAGNTGTHPTNDWKLADLFTVAPNDNAARGLLAVNQTNLAAWSAVLSGVTVVSNTSLVRPPAGQLPTSQTVRIEPASAQLQTIVASLNATRMGLFTNQIGQVTSNGYFPNLGSVLSAPALTVASPFLNTNGVNATYGITDDMYERIPEQILSLLKQDEPRVVVFAFGQSLKPANNSQVLSGPYQGMITNYQITAESAAKVVLRIDGAPRKPRVAVESYHLLPP